MLTRIKTESEIKSMREGGKRLASILSDVIANVKPGVTTFELNTIAEKGIKKLGDAPAFLNYKPYGARRPFPAVICISVDDEIVHGIPNEVEKVLKDGSIVGLDIGIIHEGLFTDMARTVAVGKIDALSQSLIDVARVSLQKGIESAICGKTVGDISNAIGNYVTSFGFSVAEDLAGHGVGHQLHEDPYVPNEGKPNNGLKLLENMTLALEPMVNQGSPRIILGSDGYTYRTSDGGRSAHFENTILIKLNGPAEILTPLDY